MYTAFSSPAALTADASAASLRPTSINFAPSFANILTAARPMPLPAPVRTIVLLASLISFPKGHNLNANTLRA